MGSSGCTDNRCVVSKALVYFVHNNTQHSASAICCLVRIVKQKPCGKMDNNVEIERSLSIKCITSVCSEFVYLHLFKIKRIEAQLSS